MIAVLCGPLRISVVSELKDYPLTRIAEIRGGRRETKAQPGPPACPPLHQPSVFPGYL